MKVINKKVLKVPEGIKYISDWKIYELPKGHCIVDKGVTGCGYTEFCLRNDSNLVLCSPRKMLLENKMEQHVNDDNILYLKNDIKEYKDIDVKIDETITKHISYCLSKGKPIKFMVTYDSAHYIVDHLKKVGQLDKFMFVADEFQSIFLDSYFKAEVENNFVNSIQDCPNIIYLSATPMLDEYLIEIDEFKNLDYYSIDWSETGYVEVLQIQRRQTNSLGSEVGKIIDDYLAGNFPITIDESGTIVKSEEAVFYMNSVTEIVRAINKRKLRPDQVNILCADTKENKKKLKKIGHEIGKIPLKGELNKMFTFCTSTCYIGADFYSTCASTYIFADPNLKWLALDISLDLPQIAGRQRDRNNPFKNNITIFYKLLRGENLEDETEFRKLQAERSRLTKGMLLDFENSIEKVGWLYTIRDSIKLSVYSENFISISKDGKPVYNKFIEIANERAWRVSQRDYQDTINVTRAIASIANVTEVSEYKDRDDKIIQTFLDTRFYNTGVFSEKLKWFCEFMDEYGDNDYIVNTLKYKIPDSRFRNYYTYFGTSKCSALKYREENLSSALNNETKSDSLSLLVYNRFKIGNKYSKKEIKEGFKEIYFKCGINILAGSNTKEKINKTPKASDIEDWFEVKDCKTFDQVSSKWENSFELLSIKKKN